MDKTEWFRNAGLGLFMHWGVYSAIGRGEWVLNRERMSWDEYRQWAEHLTAERFDADEWARLAAEAGAAYLVVTAKHHDGFCLWDTATTDWNAAARGPQRDIIGELIHACHRNGLRIGLFFSLADWSHPAYPDCYAVDWPDAWKSEEDRQKLVAYDIEQIRELVGYDEPVDIMWFDGAAPGMTPEAWRAEEILEICYASNPDMLVSNRLHVPGDFDALELHLHRAESDRPWETDWPLTDSWAWEPRDTHTKRPSELVDRLTRVTGQAGNLLLNVAPSPAGDFRDSDVAVLRGMGSHLRRCWEAFFGIEPHGLIWTQIGPITRRGNCIYLHVLRRDEPQLVYAGVANRVLSAWLLTHAGSVELPFRQESGGRVLIDGLSGARQDDWGYCIRLDLDGPPRRLGAGHQDLNF